MEAGRDLDIFVAEQLLGYKVERGSPSDETYNGASGDKLWINRAALDPLPRYSTDLGDFEEILVYFKAKLFARHMLGDGRVRVELELTGGRKVEAIGESAPHAGCLAALKARGIIPD